MKVRNAKVADVDVIHALITHYAQLDRMLFRSKAYMYDNLQLFSVAVIGRADKLFYEPCPLPSQE